MLMDLNSIASLLTEDQLEELKDNVFIERFKKNDIIYRDGEVPQYLHCLMTGKVKIYKDGVGGRSQILRVIKPVEYFGYRAYFANENFVTGAAAFENCVICMIPLELIEKWMNENVKIAIYFVNHLAKELGISDSRIVSLTQKHIRGRLAEALLFLVHNYGFEEDGITIDMNIAREDLANLSNMTTSNAIRTLSAFAQENIIEIDGKKISILDINTLSKISQIG
ncbi:MAG: Crp/Fnr family transcriptional regulator [Bacteroidaceae bacterium]|nr:Crp/Fnr family transcriptional regulator [Bacteroidaceae bacterium]